MTNAIFIMSKTFLSRQEKCMEIQMAGIWVWIWHASCWFHLPGPFLHCATLESYLKIQTHKSMPKESAFAMCKEKESNISNFPGFPGVTSWGNLRVNFVLLPWICEAMGSLTCPPPLRATDWTTLWLTSRTLWSIWVRADCFPYLSPISHCSLSRGFDKAVAVVNANVSLTVCIVKVTHSHVHGFLDIVRLAGRLLKIRFNGLCLDFTYT